jgi:hypothetical protein
LNPGIIEVRDSNQRPVAQIYSATDIGLGTDSVSIVPLSYSNYYLITRGEKGTVGSFDLEVFLVGDADGNRIVDRADADRIRAIFGAQRGDANYIVQADANLDGVISSFDLFQWQVNSSDSTRIQPLSLNAKLATTPAARLPDGTPLFNSARVELSGTTVAARQIQLDIDGDGFDDGTTTSNATGSFTLGAVLPEGTSNLRIRVSDGFGQQRIVELPVAVDTLPPITPQEHLVDLFGVQAKSRIHR